jgi:hypothetical protein
MDNRQSITTDHDNLKREESPENTGSKENEHNQETEKNSLLENLNWFFNTTGSYLNDYIITPLWDMMLWISGFFQKGEKSSDFIHLGENLEGDTHHHLVEHETNQDTNNLIPEDVHDVDTDKETKHKPQ